MNWNFFGFSSSFFSELLVLAFLVALRFFRRFFFSSREYILLEFFFLALFLQSVSLFFRNDLFGIALLSIFGPDNYTVYYEIVIYYERIKWGFSSYYFYFLPQLISKSKGILLMSTLFTHVCTHIWGIVSFFYSRRKTSSFHFSTFLQHHCRCLCLPYFFFLLFSSTQSSLEDEKKESDRSIMYNNNEHIETTPSNGSC